MLTAVIGLIGVVVGSFLTAILSERRWRKELRISAYVDVVGSARRFLFAGADVLNSDNDAKRMKAVAALRDEVATLRQSVARVRLLGPEAADSAAKVLLDHFAGNLYPHFVPPDADPVIPDADVILEGRALMDVFLTDAASVIGIAQRG